MLYYMLCEVVLYNISMLCYAMLYYILAMPGRVTEPPHAEELILLLLIMMINIIVIILVITLMLPILAIALTISTTLGFQPKTNLNEGLFEFVKWYKSYYS